MKRVLAVVAGTAGLVVGLGSPVFACGGLIGPNGAVNLLRTTTFAGYHNGVEHYVTSFAFAGGGGAFGSLTPLPGVPTKVVRGGDWTLQRLVRETSPVAEFAAGTTAPTALDLTKRAEVILQTTVDALDITVLKGGGDEVGRWATDHGFRLPPDAPEVLDFYAKRSPIFLAAAFDADKAKQRGQRIGDGTPVHITIPTQNPWVPLRILALGKTGPDQVEADVYLLTDHRPRLLSKDPIGSGFGTATVAVTYDQRANEQLLTDLRVDKSGSWVPRSGWLTKVTINGPASSVTGDLAIDPTGRRQPSMVAAGYEIPAVAAPVVPREADDSALAAIAVTLMVAAAVVTIVVSSLRGRRTA